MSNFSIIPLSAAYAERLRQTRTDDFGHLLIEQVATGYGPCRVSLQPFRPGEDRRLLFAYSPFEQANAFNQNGPVFMQAEPVLPYANVHRFPPAIKADPIHFPLTLIGYSSDQRMIFTRLVGDSDVDDLIENILNDHPRIAYLHARNAEAGCFICKIERREA